MIFFKKNASIIVGYAFLLFRDEISVHRLVKTCVAEEGKLFMFVSSVTQTHKKVHNKYTIVLRDGCFNSTYLGPD